MAGKHATNFGYTTLANPQPIPILVRTPFRQKQFLVVQSPDLGNDRQIAHLVRDLARLQDGKPNQERRLRFPGLRHDIVRLQGLWPRRPHRVSNVGVNLPQ